MKKIAVSTLFLLVISSTYALIAPAKTSKDVIVLSSSNTLSLSSEVNGESVSRLILQAKELDANLSTLSEELIHKKPLYLFLNSPGGEIQAGLELIEALKGLNRPIHTITLFAASMSFQIAQNLDDRYILTSGILMSHHAHGDATGEFGGVSASLDSRFKFWLDRIKEMDEQTVRRTKGKQTYEGYIKKYDHELWLTGAQSVKEGFADKLVVVKCDKSLDGTSTHEVDFMGLHISYDLDKCPINTSPMNVHIKAPDGRVVNDREIKNNFLSHFETTQRQVVPLHW